VKWCWPTSMPTCGARCCRIQSMATRNS